MIKSTLIAASISALLATSVSAAEYTIFLFEPQSELALRANPTEASAEGYWGVYGKFAQELIEAGALKGGTALHADAPFHLVAGKNVEGSMVPGELSLSGYFTIEAENIEAAKALAAKAPTMTRGGAAEVRESYINPLAGGPMANGNM